MCSKVLNGHIILTDTSITTILAPEMTYTPKSYTINSAYGIHTEYRIYTVRLQQLPELVPCVVRAHGVFDSLSQAVE